MVYVTVGNHYQGFERIIQKMDEIAENLGEKIIMQIGVSKYIPKNCPYFRFIPFSESSNYIKRAKVVVSHAGIGTIITASKFGTPLVILPRRKKYGEHNNDHQLEIAKAIREKKGIFVTEDMDKLEDLLKEALKGKNHPEISPGREKIISTLRDFVNEGR